MPEREPSFQPEVPIQEPTEAAEQKRAIDPRFLQEQFSLPKEQWDEQFRALVQEKSEANQRAIQETEQVIEKGEHEVPTEASTESSEVIRQQTFERYKKGLGLNEEDLKEKRILDLGSGQGDFVEQLIQEGITQKAYGLDANPENFPAEKGVSSHLFQGDFQKELPIKNLDYVVSLGAVSSSFFAGNEDVDVDSIIKNSFDALNEGGEIRIYPIQEAGKDSELIGLKESHKKWVELLSKTAETEGVQCTLEPRDIKVVGKNNDVILESVLIVKKLSEKERKEKKWNQFEERFKTETDRLGYGIEKGIMDTVVGLNAVDINTYQSCEGHVDRGRITPWVDVSAPDEPKKKWQKPTKSDQEIYDENNVSEELLGKSKQLEKKFKREMKKRDIEMDDLKERKKLAKELMAEFDISSQEAKKLSRAARQIDKEKYKPTPEHKKWMQENEELVRRAEALLAEFNQDRDVPESSRIITQPKGYGVALYNGGEDYETASQERTEEEKAELEKRLVQYRAEFQAFAEFLKEKFLGSSDKNLEKTKEESDISPEEKERKLKHDLFEVQLQYAQRLFEKKIPSPSDSIKTESMDFKQLLEEFTDLSTVVRDAFLKRTGKDFGKEENYKEFEKVNQTVIEKVVDAYNDNPDSWMNNVEVFISDAINQLPEGVPSPEARETQPEESHAGVLRYSVGAGHGGLEDYGITPEDECIKTHLDPLFKQGDVAKGKKLSELYKEAYAIIAKEVKENYPNAKALVSESWLFDTNLAKEIGLHTYPSGNENMFRSRTFWGQFINREGEINEERVKQFLETGKPPFRVRSGYILMDEFMEKYGSK